MRIGLEASRVPFYRNEIFPVLFEVGIEASEIAWLPLVKVPLPARTRIPSELIRIDRPVLREQLRLLRPRVIWVQTKAVNDHVDGIVRSTAKHVTVQKLHPYDVEAASLERRAVASDLKRFLHHETLQAGDTDALS